MYVVNLRKNAKHLQRERGAFCLKSLSTFSVKSRPHLLIIICARSLKVLNMLYHVARPEYAKAIVVKTLIEHRNDAVQSTKENNA